MDHKHFIFLDALLDLEALFGVTLPYVRVSHVHEAGYLLSR